MKRTAVVCVVDDDRDVRESMESLVQSIGYEVRLFDSAEAFFDNHGGDRCDCVVSDVQMSGMNGIALARRVIEIDSSIPVVLMSAYATKELEHEAEAIGVSRFLRKPFDADEFATFLPTLLVTEP